MSEACELLFVYGSLRRGGALHGHLAGLLPRGDGTIAARLYDLGAYPGAVPAADGERVLGELYELGAAGRLAELDELEGFHPERPEASLFLRRRVAVARSAGTPLQAWAYFLPAEPAGAARIPGGDYASSPAGASLRAGRGRSLPASMRAPVLGVTTYAPRAGLERFHLPTGYVSAVRRAGALPLLVAPGEERLEELLGHLDGLLLSGGGDLDPDFYAGQRHPLVYSVSRERDAMELALARLAFAHGLPTLGICRGCQVINVAFGGSLIEHLPDEVGERIAHRGSGPGTVARHPVELAQGSRLSGIVGTTSVTGASSHHQAIRRVAEGLSVSARAADGTIEAVERSDHPFYLAVQWHPEETAHEDPLQQRLFEALAVAARLFRGQRGSSCG